MVGQGPGNGRAFGELNSSTVDMELELDCDCGKKKINLETICRENESDMMMG